MERNGWKETLEMVAVLFVGPTPLQQESLFRQQCIIQKEYGCSEPTQDDMLDELRLPLVCNADVLRGASHKPETVF